MKRARTRNNIESPAHIQIEREIKLARTIPARNASENHISGSWANWSCNRDVVGGLITVPMQHLPTYCVSIGSGPVALQQKRFEFRSPVHGSV